MENKKSEYGDVPTILQSLEEFFIICQMNLVEPPTKMTFSKDAFYRLQAYFLSKREFQIREVGADGLVRGLFVGGVYVEIEEASETK